MRRLHGLARRTVRRTVGSSDGLPARAMPFTKMRSPTPLGKNVVITLAIKRQVSV